MRSIYILPGGVSVHFARYRLIVQSALKPIYMGARYYMIISGYGNMFCDRKVQACFDRVDQIGHSHHNDVFFTGVARNLICYH